MQSNLVHLKTFDDVQECFTLSSQLLQASYDGAKDVFFDDVLVVLDGKPHHKRRRQESPLFSGPRLQHIDDHIIPQIISYEFSHLAPNQCPELVNLTARITTRIAGAIIGIDNLETREAVTDLVPIAEHLKKCAMIEWTAEPRDIVRQRASDAATMFVNKYVNPCLSSRTEMLAGLGNEIQEHKPSDLITLLLQQRLLGGSEELDDNQIRREAMHYLVAAAGTSSLAIVLVLDELLSLAESKDADPPRNWSTVQVHSAVLETLRLHPPTMFQRRWVDNDVTLASGIELKKGQVALLDIMSANRDRSAYGESANIFNPLRDIPTRAPRWGLSFGVGVHNCLGKQLAAGSQKPEGSLLGIVTSAVSFLLNQGIRRSETQAVVKDDSTHRRAYIRYPVEFDSL